MASPVASPRLLQVPGAWSLDLGGSLPGLTIAYEEFGTRRGDGANTVLVLPALSAHSHLRRSAENPAEGWWEDMVGPGLGIDTDRWHVVCASLLGSCFGTTGPTSIDPRAGQPFGADFPQFTPRDLVRAHVALLDGLGLRKVHAVVGSSLGGMQVLEFAAQYPARLDRYIAVSMTAKTLPYTAALRRIGRQAILMDPAWNGGRYETGKGPVTGLKLAREIGTVFYRSRDEFNARFNREAVGPFDATAKTFEVESFLAAHGDKFATRFDANAYVRLSRCMDLMDLGAGSPSLDDGIRLIQARGLILGVDRDALIPPDEQRAVHAVLKAAGRDVTYEELSSIYGHDAFLKDFAWFSPRFAAFLRA